MQATPSVRLVPIDTARLDADGIDWRWWELEDGIKVTFAHLFAQGPTQAPGDVTRLQADLAGNLRVTLAGQTAFGIVQLGDNAGNIATVVATTADARAPGNGETVAAVQELFNGANFDRGRSASALNLASLSTLGVSLADAPGDWTAVSAPAAGIAASASRVAGGVGVRHLLTATSFGFSSQAALAAVATVQVNIRDGATGAGTVLKSYVFDLPAAIVAPVHIELSGLHVVGSAATAMTVEFAAAVAGLRTYANLTGHDAA